jgi:hypothetical protein
VLWARPHGCRCQQMNALRQRPQIGVAGSLLHLRQQTPASTLTTDPSWLTVLAGL